jgi:hypothetical protein
MGLVYGMAGFISFMNVILKIFLHQVGQFEKKHTITKSLASSISKMWFLQFFVIGVLVFLIHAKYGKLFTPTEQTLILSGKYKDFTSNWYHEVGAAIGMTTLVTCVFPVINFVNVFLHGIKGCCDRKCRCKKSYTNQLLQSKYEAIYLGPVLKIQEQYATLIALTLVILTYTCAMPILYFGGFIICFFMYWTDKYLFLNLY